MHEMKWEAVSTGLGCDEVFSDRNPLHVLPYMVSIENSHALPEIFSDQSTDFSLSLNGQAISTVEYLPSGIPQDRKPEYFVAEGSVPKVFLNEASGLLPVPQGTDPGPLEIGLVWSQATEPFATSTVYLQTGDFAAAPMMAMAQGASAPADPDAEWEEQVLLFFDLLTGELGQEYLEAFTHEGGTWRHDSLGWFDFDGYEANHAWFSWKGPPEVVIERDQTPPEAALCLYEGLHQHIIWNRDVRAEYYEVTQWDPQKYADLQQELVQTGGRTAALLAEAYLGGISMIGGDAADFVFIANDVSEGEYLSLAAALPFLSVQAVRYEKAVSINLPSGLIHLNAEATEALAEAWQATSRLHRMDILGPKIADGTIDRNTVEALYDSGFLMAKSRPSQLLANDMVRVGKGARPRGAIAHHDLPTAFEDRFIAAGIDPNHGDNGRWIQKRIHDSWSNLPRFRSGGPFNQLWRDFFNQPGDRSASEIFDLLQRIRSGEIFEISDLDVSALFPHIPIFPGC